MLKVRTFFKKREKFRFTKFLNCRTVTYSHQHLIFANDPKMAEGPNHPQVEEKLVRHMGFSGQERLSLLLRPYASNNYRHLADLLGFSNEEILDLQEERDPVQVLFRRRPDLTFSRLKQCLEEMERYDVLQELEPMEAETLTPSEFNKMYKERNRRAYEEETRNLTVLPDDMKYDAFICYSQEDLEFAKKILKTLEAAPYHLKLCIFYRDIIPGADKLTTVVNVIEERCRKVIVIISKYFHEDEDADFQAKIALKLSPGCKEKRLIPILLDERDYVPKILGHITHLDYRNKAAREYFWPKLAKSLGYTN